MKVKKRIKNTICSLALGGLIGAAYTANTQTTPLFKTIRTEVHKAVQKDTGWSAGPIVDQIHFLRFDSQGRLMAANSLHPNGSAASKFIFIYDDNNRIKEEISASIKTGGVDAIYQYHYDNEERINGITRLNAERNVQRTDTIIRNAAGQITQRVHHGVIIKISTQQKTEYSGTLEIAYNEQGEVVKVIENNSSKINGNSGERELQKRDTLPLRTHAESAFERFKAPRNKKVDFVYDKYNNWVKRIEYNGTIPEFMVMRNIEYAGESNDWQELLLKGKVKSVRQASYIAIAKGPETIDKGGKKGVFFSFKFDKNGRKTTTEHFSETGIPQGATEYAYNEYGNIQKETKKTIAGGTEYVIQWTYGKEMILKSKSLLNPEGQILRKGVFRYDNEENCINEIWFNLDGSRYSEFRYQYDPYGQLNIKQVTISPKDAKGKEYEPTKHIWNANGRVSETWLGLPQGMRHYTYRYSTRGEIISGTEPGEGQTEVKYTYKFFNDEQGNWKKRIKFVDNIPVTYEEREYTYYE